MNKLDKMNEQHLLFWKSNYVYIENRRKRKDISKKLYLYSIIVLKFSDY